MICWFGQAFVYIQIQASTLQKQPNKYWHTSVKWRFYILSHEILLRTHFAEAKKKSSCQHIPLHKKWSFPLTTSSVNVTKSAGNCEFGHIYWRNPCRGQLFLCSFCAVRMLFNVLIRHFIGVTRYCRIDFFIPGPIIMWSLSPTLFPLNLHFHKETFIAFYKTQHNDVKKKINNNEVNFLKNSPCEPRDE